MGGSSLLCGIADAQVIAGAVAAVVVGGNHTDFARLTCICIRLQFSQPLQGIIRGGIVHYNNLVQYIVIRKLLHQFFGSFRIVVIQDHTAQLHTHASCSCPTACSHFGCRIFSALGIVMHIASVCNTEFL